MKKDEKADGKSPPAQSDQSNQTKPMSAYVTASHLAFVIITPLVFFIGGGTWLADRLDWPDWTKLILVLVGIAAMVMSLISYLRRLITIYGDGGKEHKPPPFKGESDYYYENNPKKPKAKKSQPR